MPAFVTLDSLSYRTPDGRTLFEDLTLSFGAERTGLVGRNGVGKTTLLQLILGDLPATGGAVTVRGRLGVLRQALQPPAGANVADLLGLAEPLARLARINEGQGTADDFAEADWGLEARLGAALADIGLAELAYDRPAATLSGGQVTRAALAGLIAQAPDLLILDEPTNNLDAEARALVADLIGRWRGGAIVVSHDRELLRRMDRIVELSGLGARVYGGNYDLYQARGASEALAAARDLAEGQRTQARVAREAQAAVERQARRDAAGRRSRARRDAPKILLDAQAGRAEVSGGRGSRLAERRRNGAAGALAEAQARVERVQDLDFDLPPSGLALGKTVLEFAEVTFAHPDAAPIIAGLSFRIVGAERVAVRGPNGAGKTTLIRLAAGELEPTAGRITRGVRPAFLDQETAMLRPGETLVEAFRRLVPQASENAARAALARFLFRGAAGDRRIDALSGGERLRAAMACVLMVDRPPQLLILDEPTNHLDLDSISAVEQALRGYDGALLVVSHDRDFLETIGIEREIVLCVERSKYQNKCLNLPLP
jgi:ATPase subunit of ABC transporter with duplicated ATPase domains